MQVATLTASLEEATAARAAAEQRAAAAQAAARPALREQWEDIGAAKVRLSIVIHLAPI
jgi:hypothetical protein